MDLKAGADPGVSFFLGGGGGAKVFLCVQKHITSTKPEVPNGRGPCRAH